MMHSPAASAATTPASTPSVIPAITTATPHNQHGKNDILDHLLTKLLRGKFVQDDPGLTRHAQPVLINDFHLDTLFNPVWMSGPHVFSFAKDGTVVRPEVYLLELYPGYHMNRTRRLESINTSHFQGFSTRDSKPLKNVAVTEDDAEFAAIQVRVRANAVSEWRHHLYWNAECPMPGGEEPELVCTWPPNPHGQ